MSETLKKYNEVFMSSFNVGEEQLKDLAYKVYPEWNSMAHIALISKLEEVLEINFEADDIFALTSYDEGRSLLKSRFGLDL